MTDQSAGVDLIFQDAQHHSHIPTDFLAHVVEFFRVSVFGLEILSGRRDVLVIQHLSNRRGIASGHSRLKDTLDNLSGVRIDCQSISLCRVHSVSERSIAANILALLHHLNFGRCRFDGKIFAICGINDATHHNLKTSGCAFVILAVISIIDGNEPDTHKREGAFQIVSGLDIITRKAGKILDDDQVDLAVAHLFHHCCELRALKVRTGIAIIGKLKPRILGQHRMIVKIPVDEHTLVSDAVTFYFGAVAGIFVSHREAYVDADGVVLAHLHRLLNFFDTLNGQRIDVTIFHDQLHRAVFMDFNQLNRFIYQLLRKLGCCTYGLHQCDPLVVNRHGLIELAAALNSLIQTAGQIGKLLVIAFLCKSVFFFIQNAFCKVLIEPRAFFGYTA